jgi:RNA polymerase sigma-70 factor (sigma-E family)
MMTDDFEDFVLAEGDNLARLARLLCGDWHLAEGLVQSALLRCVSAWPRIRSVESPTAFVRRVLVDTYLNRWRFRARRPESLGATIPDGGDPSDRYATVDERAVLLDALRRLPRRQRAVVVLRYYTDASEREVAALLNCSVGTVKTQSAKGLDALRTAVTALSAQPEVHL